MLDAEDLPCQNEGITAQGCECANPRTRKINILGFAGEIKDLPAVFSDDLQNLLTNLLSARPLPINDPARGNRAPSTDLGGNRREGRNKVKSIKMLGLAALAALMAMAFVGASSAMAETTALCTADQSPCSAGNVISHVHETTLAGSGATLLNSVGNVVCDALFLSSAASSLGNPSVTVTGNFTYSNCKRGSESCTATELSGPSNITVLKEGHETAKVVGEGEVKVKCGSFINCTYNGEGLVGTGKGPLLSSETNGSVSLSEQTTHKVSGFLCPAEGKLDIVTTPLSATYISS